MISKFYDIAKLKNKTNFFLFYGENDGLKEDTIKSNFKGYSKENTFKYFEKDIINNKEILLDNIFTKSFFNNDKLILIYDATDKINDLINDIIASKPKDIKLILISKKLDKKSKIRSFFEKDKELSCTPFYEDNLQTLILVAQKFLKENNINISQENLNLIIERSKGDRINLKNELEKISNFYQIKKRINLEDILKLTNLSENYSANELVDSCLSKNKRKTLNILNENIPSTDDNILILKTFLYKLKRLKKLKTDLNENKNIELTINSHKPPIFWKEKDIIKQQLKSWELGQISEFIKNINDLEKLIKINPQISDKILNNMIMEKI